MSWLTINFKELLITAGLSLGIDGSALVSAPMLSSHFLQYKGLIADNNSGRSVAIERTSFEKPSDVSDPRIGGYCALEVDITSFAYLISYVGAQC